jgi:hypothetical protein
VDTGWGELAELDQRLTVPQLRLSDITTPQAHLAKPDEPTRRVSTPASPQLAHELKVCLRIVQAAVRDGQPTEMRRRLHQTPRVARGSSESIAFVQQSSRSFDIPGFGGGRRQERELNRGLAWDADGPRQRHAFLEKRDTAGRVGIVSSQSQLA